ncbi:MAG: NAD-dependent epimerase [Crocinitomicaceae bacterium]|nr:NAD-dependent epimerase [Crocinitomicaceae bacterium]|tara:strand:+ start:89 stop:1036 length:948 start_codon:yes stop_codon:yes gene_type:complete
MSRKLIIGSSGQIGTELVIKLREICGKDNVVAADIKQPIDEVFYGGPYEEINVLDKERIKDVVLKYKVEEVYILAALLSATAEKKPDLAWKLNMEGLFNVLELAKEKVIKKIFWPSSIAVFGPTTPSKNTPQHTIMEPTTVYGISKLAGERWCEYFFNKYDIDIRSIRYPGLISYKSSPGGGTTDYAIEIFHHAIKHGNYVCFLEKNRALPMMYMDDAIRATIELMEADKEKISIRSSYNVGGISFTPFEITQEIKKTLPNFEISYSPDFRNEIAKSWPSHINDQVARKDWGWRPNIDLDQMCQTMLKQLKTDFV